MESDEEHDHDADVQSATLTGFLFGNINKRGELEDDVLDETSKRHLSALSALGVGSLVKEITADTQFHDPQDDTGASADGTIQQAENAVDYFDIKEMAEEEEEVKEVQNAMAKMTAPKTANSDEDDYDEDEKDKDKPSSGSPSNVVSDSKLMPPPSWIPSGDSAKVTTEEESCKSPNDAEDKPTANAPLAALLPPELRNQDVRELFPEFRPGEVLRFSRLFKPVYTPHIWKRKKKKREDASGEGPEPTEGKPTDKGESVTVKKESSSDASETLIKEEPADLPDVVPEEDDNWVVIPELKLDLGEPARPEDMMPDDAVAHVQMDKEKSGDDAGAGNGKDVRPQNSAWRFGPAQLWYDMLGIDETATDLDYGFKLKEFHDSREEEVHDRNSSTPPSGDDVPPPPPPIPKISFPDEAFTMVNQVQWEDDIIWNGEEVKQKILGGQKQRGAPAGWIPSSTSRTAMQYHQQMSGKTYNPVTTIGSGSFKLGSMPSGKQLPLGNQKEEDEQDNWYSIFPVENQELVYGKWEDDIIWDIDNMERLPEPPVLTLDPNDENIILAIPEDRDPKTENKGAPATKEKKEARKSKILLSKTGIIKEDDEEPEEEAETIESKDPYNISNDEYYNPKLTTDTALGRNMGGSLIQHSNPALELRQPFFPTHLGPMKLRTFHRPLLKKYSHGPMANPGPHAVLPLLKTIKRKAKIREQERMASGGGEMFFMRTAEDLTGRDAEIILAEFSEEFPPLINQVGMCTKIKNYYKRKPGKDANPPQFKFGELAYAHTSPFMGQLIPGQCLPAFVNNMYRAPIFEHTVPDTDFIVIRTRQHFYIRDVKTIYTIGQECPLFEVPGPNSKRANNFVRDFLQVFIYRLFWKSRDVPRRIKMEEIKKAFPSHSESSIRKRLKLCADFKRTGMDSNWWVLKSDFRLPTEEEMRAMVSAEQCCSYYSLVAAEQRLRDAGYGEKSLFAIEDDNDDDTQSKMDDEVRAAPWNTTRAYIAAMKNKCLLALTGVADPTGCGEGFSYVKVPNKPPQTKDEQHSQTPVKRTVTGTDADLRRLSLKDAKQLLRKFGVPEGEIKKLSRWEVIDVVRTMSTEQAKAGQESGAAINKFARGNRFSVAEHQERYKEECQRIFDLQNRILASEEVLSTDEGSSSDDDSDMEEIGKKIENMLSNKKSSSQISHDEEEAERRELQKMMRDKDFSPKDKKKDDKKNDDCMPSGMRKLIITRTFVKEDGTEFTRTEVVKKQAVIETYMRIRQTKDKGFIRQFATLDDTQKEEMKKERRRLQEQLRRIKRQQERGGSNDGYMGEGSPLLSPLSSLGTSISMPRHSMSRTPPSARRLKKEKKKKEKEIKINMKLKCGACGQMGHMRTNKECPLYNKAAAPPVVMSGPVAVTEEQEEEFEKSDLVDQDLINVEGTTVKISKTLVKHVDAVKRKSLVLKFPKMMTENKKRRRAGTIVHCDYLKKPKKLANRRRADPVVTLSSIFEGILSEMRDIPNTQPFLTPVNPKQVPDYHRIVKKPMDMQTVRQSIRERKYLSREPFLKDISQITRNSELYNGAKSVLTVTAQKMLDICLQRLAEKEDRLMRLEKAINPLLDDNDQVALSYIFSTIIDTKLKTVENSYPFQNPVNKKLVKDYYEVIQKPMDLNTLSKNAIAHRYKSREQFAYDVELIHINSMKYNGKDSAFTATAKHMLEVCIDALKEQEESCMQLEENIRQAEEAALEAADLDSVITGNSYNQDGMDFESVGDSASMQKENVTIIEHEDDYEYQDDSRDASHLHGMVHDEDYVDVEGDDEELAAYRQQQEQAALEDDLRITPENSEDEEVDGQRYTGRLSSSGSDTGEDEGGDGGHYGAADPAAYQQPIAYDENAQDITYVDPSTMAAIQQMNESQFQDNEDDESFDPGEFFANYPQGGGGGNDINTDLQVSESEDEGGGEFMEVEQEDM